MKYLILFFTILILSIPSDAQNRKRHDPSKKIEELKKIKLIEALQMDEETTLRFFARRNEHKSRMEQLHKEEEEMLKNIEREIGEESDENLLNMVKNYKNIQNNIHKEREAFLFSLNDILSNEQIAKLVVFEKRFMEEIRHILFKERKRR